MKIYFNNNRNINVNKLILLFIGLIGNFISCFQLVNASPVLPASSVPYTTYDPARIKGVDLSKKQQDLFKKQEKIQTQKEQAPLKPPEGVDLIKFKLSEVIITGVTLYETSDFLQYYKDYLGKDVSLIDLQNIANAITSHYRGKGYMISKAVVPEQQVELGKVKIQVVEGYIGEVYIEGNANNKLRSRLEKYAEEIKKMRPLQIKTLERYILLLNDLYGVSVKTVLSPAPTLLGASDLILVVNQKKTSLEFSSDNRGSRYLGPNENIAVAEANNIIMGGDDLSMQTIHTPFHNELCYMQLNYGYPVGINGMRVDIDANYTETRPGFTLKDFGFIGRGKGFDIKVDYPLLRTRSDNIRVYGKFNFINSFTKNELEPVFKDHIRSIRFGVTYDSIDRWQGSNSINLEASKGLHVLGASPLNPTDVRLSRPEGCSDYNKINLSVSRYQFFLNRFVLLAALSGQYSFNGRLLSAEEFGFGGPQFGRAYDPSEVVGDAGMAIKMELRTNTYFDWSFLRQIQYYAFYEGGVVWNVDASQPYRDSAVDIGAGLRFVFNDYFYGNLEAAKPLTRKVDTQVAAGGGGKDYRIYFGFGLKL